MKVIVTTKNVTISIPETREEFNNGSFGQLFHKRTGLGATVPALGYYKIVSVIDPSTTNAKSQPICAYYNALSSNSFTEEIVSFEGKFLFNKMSEGNKNTLLKEDMIIHIKDTRLVDAEFKGKPYSTYQIKWEIMNMENPIPQTTKKNYSEDPEFYPEDYYNEELEYSREELDDMYLDAFDGNEEAYWNID